MFSNFIMLNLVPIRKGIIVLLGTCDTYTRFFHSKGPQNALHLFLASIKIQKETL